MRVLLAHNYYQESGGEDTVFQNEKAMLEANGHEVFAYIEKNAKINEYSFRQRCKLPAKAIFSKETYFAIAGIIDEFAPRIVHVHNTFPLISPSIYYASSRKGVPVVQTLHNPRLMCPSGNFWRNNALCRDCQGKTVPWNGILHGCYRGSHLETGAVALLLSVHNMIGTWRNKVSVYIASTEFYRGLFVEAGIPPEKIVVKPHFAPDPGTRAPTEGSYGLYVGRLESEKGGVTLLRALEHLRGVPLLIRGEGRLLPDFEWTIREKGLDNVRIVGRLNRDDLTRLVKGARFLIWPSEGYYETFGMVAVEAFACGVPVVASRTGVATNLVTHNLTGVFFDPGDPRDLAEKALSAWGNASHTAWMGTNARREYEQKYTEGRNYQMLMGVYQRLLAVDGASDESSRLGGA